MHGTACLLTGGLTEIQDICVTVERLFCNQSPPPHVAECPAGAARARAEPNLRAVLTIDRGIVDCEFGAGFLAPIARKGAPRPLAFEEIFESRVLDISTAASGRSPLAAAPMPPPSRHPQEWFMSTNDIQTRAVRSPDARPADPERGPERPKGPLTDATLRTGRPGKGASPSQIAMVWCCARYERLHDMDAHLSGRGREGAPLPVIFRQR
jgi:hypothetical protein